MAQKIFVVEDRQFRTESDYACARRDKEIIDKLRAETDFGDREALGKLAAERGLPVQSHLSENTGEVAWVRELHPDCAQYWETYAKYGLWNDRTLMAHCVWSDGRERAAMREAGVTVVHCPDSNQNICSGVAHVRAMLKEGLKVALGSDIAGGDHLNMFDVTAAAIRASKARRILDDWGTDFLTVAEGWYLGTSAGAGFLRRAENGTEYISI